MEISGLLSPLAACAYLATSAFALIAAFRAPARRRELALFNWFAVVVIFVLLAVWRLDNGEALVQDQLRNWTRANGTYDDRHSFQVPITLAAVVAVAGLIWLAGRASGAAHSGKGLCAALIMAVFTAVRATSLHAVDALLYQSVGPIHVNYLIDLGLTAVVAAFALADCRLVAAPPPPPRRSSSRSGSSSHGSRRRSRSRDHDRR
jgi:hypothetical protein